jgi:hypothetical protein
LGGGVAKIKKELSLMWKIFLQGANYGAPPLEMLLESCFITYLLTTFLIISW